MHNFLQELVFDGAEMAEIQFDSHQPQHATMAFTVDEQFFFPLF